MATSQKLYYTAIIFLGHFTFVSDFKRSNKVSFNLPPSLFHQGTLSGIAGPSLVDFTYLLSSEKSDGSVSTSSIKEVSYFMTFSMLGAIAGSFGKLSVE